MWRVTLLADTILMMVFWALSAVLVAFANNRLVQYGGGEVYLPALTSLALSAQGWIGALPLAWIALSFFLWKRLDRCEAALRTEYLLCFTALTLALGAVLVTFYALAGVLPFLLIGGTLP